MSSWSCPHEDRGLCRKVARAHCRPGMKGCVLAGKVQFQDGAVPSPVWPEKKGSEVEGPRTAGSEGKGAAGVLGVPRQGGTG